MILLIHIVIPKHAFRNVLAQSLVIIVALTNAGQNTGLRTYCTKYAVNHASDFLDWIRYHANDFLHSFFFKSKISASSGLSACTLYLMWSSCPPARAHVRLLPDCSSSGLGPTLCRSSVLAPRFLLCGVTFSPGHEFCMMARLCS